jgi:hypothetical protein
MGGINHTVTYRAQYQTGGAWVNFPGLLSVETDIESSGGAGGPFAFGGSVLPRATLRCGPTAPATGWRRAPVRAWHTVEIDGVALPEERVFTGVLLSRDPDGDGWTFVAGGWDEEIATTEIRTALKYLRPLATATTITSVEDPTAGGYAGGVLNELFWRGGGRPGDELGGPMRPEYASAPWFYRCDGSSTTVEWPWVDGENAWQEALLLAEHAGGQVFMDNVGVMRYVNPLVLAEAVAGAPIIADTGPAAAGRILYDGELQIREDVRNAFNVAICTFQRRARQPRQEVYSARDPFVIEASANATRPLATRWPVLWRELLTGAVDYTVRVVACRFDGTPVTPVVTVISESAQLLTIQIANPLGEPILIASIAVDGRPVSTIQDGEARYVGPRFDANGARDVVRRLPESQYTQSQDAAERRARMAVEFVGVPRRTFVADNCPWEPGVRVGGYARLYSARRALVDVPCRIIGRKILNSGERMQLTLAEVTGLPKLSELWVIGQTYADGDVRKLGL